MKKLFLHTILLLTSIFLLINCKKNHSSPSTPSGNWLGIAQFAGSPRMAATSWVIGDTGYLVSGYNSVYKNYFNDLWQFDPVQSAWVQKAAFPGTGRQSSVGFVVGNNGYLATGYNLLTQQIFQDCWKYNPTTNVWTKMMDLPDASGGRYDAIAFTIGNYGYVGTGKLMDGSYLNDFWKFDPVTNSWTSLGNGPLNKRAGAVAFTTYNDTAAYIVTGTDGSNELTDFWKYSPTASWVRLRDITNSNQTDTYDNDYTDIARDHAVALVEPNNGVWKAYITTGTIDSAYTSKTWEYDFAKDLWVRKTPYERPMRQQAVSWSFLNLKRGFVGTGREATLSLDDYDEWLPAKIYNAVD